MAEKKIIMQYRNSTGYDTVYPKTTTDQVDGLQTALDDKEDADNKVTAISAESSDTQYPSAKCVYDAIQGASGGGSYLYTGTLDADNWSSSSQTLTIQGLEVNNYTYIVAPTSTYFNDWCENGIYAIEVTTANNITFNCSTTPANDIDVTILKIRTL